MRVNDDLRKSVLFLGDETQEANGEIGIDPKGTGFLVGVGGQLDTRPYLVTAAHVARGLGSSPFVVRINLKAGGSQVVLIDKVRWHFHKDETVDVAVMECEIASWVDFVLLPVEMFLTSDEIKKYDIGVGDMVHIVGLFHLMGGRNRNIPMVHTGHIAMEPNDELIPVHDPSLGKTVRARAYLIEAHALPGVSGAPVFVRPSVPVAAAHAKTREMYHGNVHGSLQLLGLWQSSWPGTPDDVARRAMNLRPNDRVPIGMGVVVPANKIIELLMEDKEVLEMRAKTLEAIKRAGASSTDALSAEPTPAAEVEPDHREAFNRLVAKAATAKPKDDRT